MKESKTAILHISDLHMADVKFTDNEASLFQKSKSYINIFINRLKEIVEQEHITKLYLIVTGDLTQSSEEEEYDDALIILNEICDELCICKANVMIVPGNHDINWSHFKHKLKTEGITDKQNFHKYSEYKFEYFKSFYEKFYEGEKIFDPQKVIVDTIFINDLSLIFVGLNSIYRETHLKVDHVGSINISELKKELKLLEGDLSGNSLFGVLHHNPNAVGDDPPGIENWGEVLPIFKQYKFNKFICGHTHVSHASTIKYKDSMDFVVTGSIGLASDDIDNTFLIMVSDTDENDNIGLRPIFFKREKEGQEETYWQELSNKKNTIPFIVTKEKKGQKALEEIIEKVAKTYEEDELSNSSKMPMEKQNQDEYDIKIKEYLIRTIKKNNLYISGHFHWSDRGRSHSFIQTNYLFENYDCVEKIKLCYLNLLKKQKGEVDLLIGYAMQGNVMGSLLAIEKGWKYSYCPAVGKRYSEYEKEFPEGDFKSIVVIADLVYTDNLLKWLVKILKGKYKELTKITIYALFDTNDIEVNLKTHMGIQVDFHSSYHIPINTCPFSDPNECIIYKENLETVNILYSEEE